ncbi:nucleoside triphosphate pyrophosphohydrolase [bacterium]|jgi:tetrapyrrole methylase family protein/MazG family protein|nr:nucleoside triphosphate pyrophosphohydrolase [bacterium]
MTARVVIVGLGPGPRNTVTQATLEAIERIDVQFVRTKRHPTADLMPRATSFDSLYDTLPTFEDVYREITEAVVAAAIEHGEVLYAVPGSPLILESSVAQLRADSRVEVQVLPALSFLDLAWEALGIDPVNAGVRLIDGHRFALEASGERGPLLVAQVHADWVLSDVKLSHESANGNEPVVLLHHLGLPDQRVEHTTWQELDRVLPADHLTTLYIPQMAEPVSGELARLHQLARTLREQCPWDREQTHDSLIKHLIEETYEVVDAIEALDADDPATDEAFIEELGDLLYQVEFHATIAEQQGRFSMADVARSIHDKLVRRHPHVFGDVVANSANDVVQTWDEVKRAEKKSIDGTASTFTGVAKSGPSLQYATKIQKRAADVGFDWPNADGAFEKIVEESAEIRQAVALNSDPETVRMELGDLLFSVVNLSRHLGHDAEQALRGASDKFRHRFEQVEQLALSRKIDLANAPLEQLDALWDEVKKQ